MKRTVDKRLYQHGAYKWNNKPDITLDLSIKDFGPISSGNITLKPLTIFVGPNNSGKSYASILIHSIINAESSMSQLSRRYMYSTKQMDEIRKEIFKILKTNKSSFSVPSRLVTKIIKDLVSDVIKKQIPDKINKNFSSEHGDLIRAGARTSLLKIHTKTIKAEITISSKSTKITTSVFPKLKIRVNLDPRGVGRNAVAIEENGITINVRKYPPEILAEEIMESIVHFVGKYFFENTTDSIYFPAARSGILQGHKVISASIVQAAPYAGLGSLEIPKLSGVVSDFISNILVMSHRLGTFAKDARRLEDDILHGQIMMDTQNSISEIKYSHKKQHMPLHRTSSAVSELAPFVLYLKHVVREGNLLIIEEPEAHLHPHHQLLFTKFLVRLIRKGLKVIVTTHSPLIIDQLNNFLLVGKISPTDRVAKLGFHENEFLKIDEVSAYIFKQSPAGSTVRLLEISEDDGIPPEEFIKISESLYEESLKVQDHLRGD